MVAAHQQQLKAQASLRSFFSVKLGVGGILVIAFSKMSFELALLWLK